MNGCQKAICTIQFVFAKKSTVISDCKNTLCHKARAAQVTAFTNVANTLDEQTGKLFKEDLRVHMGDRLAIYKAPKHLVCFQ